MCGIVGFSGKNNAPNRLVGGLKNLEYRGYDSAGVAFIKEDTLVTIKAKGRVSELEKKLGQCFNTIACGIAHTRWATHGEPSDVNSHPHATEKVALVHNGIIENYSEIKQELTAQGYQFHSMTDTETAACLLDFFYKGDPIQAIKQTLAKIEGSYAFGILFKDFPNTIYGVKKDSPLAVAVSPEGNFIVSDITAVIEHTNQYFLLEEQEIAIVDANGVTVVDFEKNKIEKQVQTANWNSIDLNKDGFAHFMLKEIAEQKKVVGNTIRERIQDNLPCFEKDGILDTDLQGISKIHIVACGTAMNAGLLGKDFIRSLARIDTSVEIASEFRYNNPILGKNDLVIIISQSGETADSLAALRLAKRKGIKTLAIVNVIGSTIANEADFFIHTLAGPEIAVASTKAYSVQVATLYLLAFKLAYLYNIKSKEQVQTLVEEFLATVALMGKDTYPQMDKITDYLKEAKQIFFIGRGLDWRLCEEGSLKLKEISYINCQAYAAGELKHGTISLIEEGVPVIVLATQKELLPKMLSNVKEVRARGAKVFLITNSTILDDDIYDACIQISDISDLFTPLIAVRALQIIAYETSLKLGCDIDKPRNLAKSVTVE